MSSKTLHVVKQMLLLFQRDSIFRTHFKHIWHPTITYKDASHSENASTNNSQTSSCFPWISRLLQKICQKLCKIAKPLTLLTHQQVKFDWTPSHHEAFLHLKESITQAPILHYPDPNKRYIVYIYASDDACGAQLSQEHDGTEFPIAFLLHTCLETQRKWSTTEQEAYGVYYAITKWNYYLQGADIIVRNDHKPLTKFLNGKNANNKVNRWGLKLATYNITVECISGAQNKAADCLSCLVELPQPTPAPINLLSVTNSNGPAFNTRSQTHQCISADTSTAQPDVTSEDLEVPDPTPKSLTGDRLEALLEMQTLFVTESPSTYQM